MVKLNELKDSSAVLIVTDDGDRNTSQYAHLKAAKFSTIQTLQDFAAGSIEQALVTVDPAVITTQTWAHLFKVLQPEGQLHLTNLSDPNTTEFNLKTNGFVNISVADTITASKPKYAVGSSVKLNLKKPTTVWKLDDDDDELIDPDELLDSDDLVKPDAATLKVCSTTGKRKACKDCSCGLAEELAAEVQSGKVVDTGDAPKSSCGSCYLGDAFRCASCPYLGMPAFKPGEKVQLSSSLLKNDV